MALAPNRTKKFFNTKTFTTAKTQVEEPISVPAEANGLTVQMVFGGTVTGGTAAKVYVQTSFDGGSTWVDIICFANANTARTAISSVKVGTAVAANYAPTDGTLADNTIKDGLLGDRVRTKVVSTGTYDATGATVVVTGTFNEAHP